MRKIIASEMITVDGYFAGEDGALDWFVQAESLGNRSESRVQWQEHRTSSERAPHGKKA